ncbi:hypothetical protein GN958_ATG07419 [Phytophthora infestans]|uniref:Uncharacterized protein n=1 Tax=Phytophthora infestans TaxID=4787 RepID=A0A8S9USA5_PHYIN|nr:hypothetical protein GN958_ATG07419 [Phytophthora infestans]
MELHELILSRVGRDGRQRSCNSVLEDENFSIASRAAATIAKVVEVYNLKKQLQQVNVLTGGSEILMREMENTMKLQRKLEKAHKMALVSEYRTEVGASGEWMMAV